MNKPLVFILTLVVGLVACGKDPNPPPPPEPTPQATVVPPEPTAEPTMVPTELPECSPFLPRQTNCRTPVPKVK